MTELFTSLLVQKIALSLAIGAILGMEREHSKKQGLAGIRTFALLALLGTIFVEVAQLTKSDLMIPLGFAAVTALSILMYYGSMTKFHQVGLTTAIAFLFSYILGVLVGLGLFTEAVFITVAVTIVLFAKEKLHAIVDKLKYSEVLDFLEFLALIGIAFPLLPVTPLKYFGILIDFQAIWLLVVLISIINLVGFIGSRYLSSKKSFGLLTFLGGLVSSTAICMSVTQIYKKHKNKDHFLRSAYFIINSAMLLRNFVIIGILAPFVIQPLIFPIIITSALMLGYGYLKTIKIKERSKLRISSPFAVTKAIELSIKLFLIIIALEAIQVYLPDIFFLAVFLGGVTSSASTIASIATLASQSSIDTSTAVLASMVTMAANLALGNVAVYYLSGAKTAAKRVFPIALVSTAIFFVLFYLVTGFVL